MNLIQRNIAYTLKKYEEVIQYNFPDEDINTIKDDDGRCYCASEFWAKITSKDVSFWQYVFAWIMIVPVASVSMFMVGLRNLFSR